MNLLNYPVKKNGSANTKFCVNAYIYTYTPWSGIMLIMLIKIFTVHIYIFTVEMIVSR